MTNIKSKGISNIAIAVFVALFAMMLMLFQFFYIGIILKKEAENESREIASLTAQEIAQSIQVYFRDALSITQTYADNFLVYRQNNIPRTTIYNLMHNTITLNEKFLAIWTMMEPDAYDKNDALYKNDTIHDPRGSFAIAYYYENGKIKQEINDTNDYFEDFYTIPKKYKKPVILDPFYYQYHGNSKVFFETSLISPILNKNEFLGVIGIDIDMYALQKKYNNKSVYNNGYICILSNSGQIVTHKYPQYVDQNLAKFVSDEKYSIVDSLNTGRAFVTESVSKFTGVEAIRYYFPINIEYMAAPWYIMIEIPQSKIFEKSNSLKSVSFIFLTSSLLLLTYLIFNIIDRKLKEKKLIENINNLEKSEIHIKETNAELRKNKRIQEAIFNQTFSFAGLLSTDGRIIAVNQPALDFIQKKEHEISGLPFEEALWWKDSPDKEKLKQSIKLAAEGQHISFETQHVDINGKSIPFLFSIKPIYGADGTVNFLLPEGIDISKIKETENELERYRQHLEMLVKERTEELAAKNDELTQSNSELVIQRQSLIRTLDDLRKTQEQLFQSDKMASLGILAAGVAHEINNPLNFIQGGIEGLETYFNKNLTEHLKEVNPLINGIQIGVSRAASIITSLNHYSRQDSEMRAKCDIHVIIDNCLIMLQNQTKGRIEIKKSYFPEPVITIGNESKLHQAFLNLLSNAVQAIESEGKISVFTSAEKGKINIKIEDTGCGIEKDDLNKIFDPFFTTKAPGKGTGLGLSITYNIIKEHGGSIEFLSEPGKGTSVSIFVPLKE